MFFCVDITPSIIYNKTKISYILDKLTLKWKSFNHFKIIQHIWALARTKCEEVKRWISKMRLDYLWLVSQVLRISIFFVRCPIILGKICIPFTWLQWHLAYFWFIRLLYGKWRVYSNLSMALRNRLIQVSEFHKKRYEY